MPLAFSRRPTAIGESTLPPIRETDLDRILKLIPTEVLAVYMAAVPMISQTPGRHCPLLLFLGGAALVPLVLYLDGRGTRQAARWPQYVVRMLTFAAWASAMTWPFAPWAFEQDRAWVCSLAVLIVPLVGALVLRDTLPAAPPS